MAYKRKTAHWGTKDIEVFFSERYIPEPNTGCWLWIGGWAPFGHGVIRMGSKAKGQIYKMAHRVAYELYKGPIPDGMCVCHKCDVPQCVNPEHLFLGTYADNMHDMWKKGRARIENHMKGVDVWCAKLDDDKVREILASTESSRKIATRLGVGKTAVLRVRRGIGWKHVEL
jgi:hypothetical protein